MYFNVSAINVCNANLCSQYSSSQISYFNQELDHICNFTSSSVQETWKFVLIIPKTYWYKKIHKKSSVNDFIQTLCIKEKSNHIKLSNCLAHIQNLFPSRTLKRYWVHEQTLRIKEEPGSTSFELHGNKLILLTLRRRKHQQTFQLSCSEPEPYTCRTMNLLWALNSNSII